MSQPTNKRFRIDDPPERFTNDPLLRIEVAQSLAMPAGDRGHPT
jgi:hypothetical protein